MPAGTLRMVRAMACAYDAHRIHTDGVRGGGTEKGSAMTAMPPNDRFDRFDRFSKLVPRFDHLKWKMAAAGILVGLISGFLVVLYRLGIEYGTDTARWIYARIRETPWLVAPWAVAAIAAALAIAWMVKKEPMAGGSGIPQTNGVVICGLKMRWQTILPVRFIGGLLGSLFGLSLGREGPSIQIGASGAQFLSHRLRGKKREDVQEHYLVTAGAAAGLSAAFSAPLSGMMFALEGVHRSFSPAILMGATAASLTADFVSKYCFGLRPVLDFGTIGQLPLGEYGWLIPLGLVAGLVGSLMNRSLLGFQTLYGKLPAWSRPLIAIALALPIGIWLPDVLGGGSNLIAMAEHARVGLGMLCVLFVVKVLFTSTSFGRRRYLRRDVAPVRQPAVRFRGDFRGMRDDGHAGRVRENTDHVDSAGRGNVRHVDAHAAGRRRRVHRTARLRPAAYETDLRRAAGTVHARARRHDGNRQSHRQRHHGTACGNGRDRGRQADA